MKLKSYYPAEIDVDGETMKIRVKRLNFGEGSELRAKIREAQTARANDEGEGVFGEDLVSETIRKYASVESTVILETENGADVPVKSGEELLDAFGGRNEILLAMYRAVLLQNKLTDEQKKVSRSPTGSKPSSDESGKEAVGPKREMTAADAGSVDSASNGDATKEAISPYGSTDQATRPSSPTSARSYH